MKKKAKICFILVIILISLMLGITVLNAAIGGKIYVSNGNFYNTDENAWDNVFCIDKKTTFNQGWYTIEEEKSIAQDDKNKYHKAFSYVLAYRDNKNSPIYQGIAYGDKRKEHKGESAQWAVWKITNDTNIGIGKKDQTVTINGERLTINEDMFYYGEDNVWRFQLYANAMAYGRYTGPNIPDKITVDSNGNINVGSINKTSSYSVEYDHNSGTKKVYTANLTLAGIDSVTVGGTRINPDKNGNYNIGNNIGEVVVTYYEYKTSAEYSKLIKTGSQEIIIGSGDVEKVYYTRTTNITTPKASLQKFILAVNGNRLDQTDSTDGTLLGKENELTDAMCKRYNKRPTSIQNIQQISVKAKVTDAEWTNKDYYKYNNPVVIDEGDKVTYQISLYNNNYANGTYNPIAGIQVRDYFSIMEDQTTLYNRYLSVGRKGSGTNVEILGITIVKATGQDGSGEKNEQNITDYIIESDKRIIFNNLSFEKGEAMAKIRLTVKFNVNPGDRIIRNFAELRSNISSKYRYMDGDFIKMRNAKYSVALEKFVTKVEDKENKVMYESYEREEKRLNPQATENLAENNKTWKKENPIEVESGDIVTYTIRLFNTGNSPVKVSSIYDEFINEDGKKLKYISIEGNGGATISNQNYTGPSNNWKFTTQDGEKASRYLILFNNPRMIEVGEFIDVTIKFEVEMTTITENTLLSNRAGIVDIKNLSGEVVEDSDRISNNADMDYLKTKKYSVSLEKFIYAVNGNFSDISGREGHPIYQDSKTKYNNVVVANKDDYVTYKIKVTNTGDGSDYADVKKLTVIDKILGEESSKTGAGFEGYYLGEYNEKATLITDNKTPEYTISDGLAKGETKHFYITLKVSENNMSIETLVNRAEIKDDLIINKNDKTIKDTTPEDNYDEDYINMKDIIISGTVWNDKALDKIQDNYNGTFDNEKENKLPEIKVYLYRDNKIVATTTTDDNGNYIFNTTSNNGPIKASKVKETNRWDKYYSYYIVFEYDGITYTSTKFADVTSDNALDSNAKEDNGKVKENREDFNNKFSTVNSETGINYTTKNEEKYIPQSNHVYNEDTMAIQSSTSKIALSNNTDLEEQLKHVNLGLRGRDIFDLELISDVDNVKVTVNNVEGEYKYTNKVKLRQEDLDKETKTSEDMANIENEETHTYVDRQDQNIRNSDYNVDTTRYNESQGISKIEVTYKITVQNASRTKGTATKITNYYDSKYTFEEAKAGKNCGISDVQEVTNGNGYNSVVITTTGSMLNQSETMEVYLVYTLNKPIKTTLEGLSKDNPIPTYNMAEITEYKTECAEGQTEYTRGLIDKDSAPGSANTEKVRLTEGSSELTTVGYYFAAKDLNKLKYEDDTYATPTLYFLIPYDDNDTEDPGDDNYHDRSIIGIVFEDKTTVDSTTRIKTGNGKLEEGEVGVYGATVELIEQLEDSEKVRITTTTDKDGKFTISGFLPGKYIIKYHYGDTTNTVLLHQNGEVNKQSYNGEDYQATNNTGNHNSSKLNDKTDYWYVYNENDGISTAKDNIARRNEVTSKVVSFSEQKMSVLNNMRDIVGTYNEETDTLTATKKYNKEKTELVDSEKIVTGVKEVINDTKMNAATPEMVFGLEKTEIVDDKPVQRTEFSEYCVSNMNFGIAEVPVTTIDFRKEVQSFTLTDATGNNVIAGISKDENGNWVPIGNVLVGNTIDVSVEDEKLQGARLQITYKISTQMSTERNFDNTEVNVIPTITGLEDYIDNNLSYNENLGENSKYWEIIKDNNKTEYSTIVKATNENQILKTVNGEGTTYITLEKVLSSTNATLEDIITSAIDAYEYNNTVKITKLNYTNVTSSETGNEEIGNEGATNPGDGSTEELAPRKDLVRTQDRYIILPGVQHDSAISETITIHPPTGDSSINTIYYVLALVSLVVIAIGAFGIKKFIVKK